MESAPLFVVVGPTASGKSDLALHLAEQIHGEIVNADSVQIYRHFDIGSGKPTVSERERAPHHLLGSHDPNEVVDAAQFAAMATQAIIDIRQRGKAPIVCGGTYLWVRALIFGLADAPPRDNDIRLRHQNIVAAAGRGALHEELRLIDPVSHARLAPNDFVRVSRALEVYELTGKPLSLLHAHHGFKGAKQPAVLLGIQREPMELTRRIEARVKSMFELGWLEEVRDLLARGYQHTRAMQSVGYREVCAALSAGNSFDQADLELTIVRKTRIFARRQRTWLRDEPVHWLDAEAIEDVQAEKLAALPLWTSTKP